MRAGAHPGDRCLQGWWSGSMEGLQGRARCRRRMGRVRQERDESRSPGAMPRSRDDFHERARATERWPRSTLSVRMPMRLAMSCGSAWM